jgi:hypothetical protein
MTAVAIVALLLATPQDVQPKQHGATKASAPKNEDKPSSLIDVLYRKIWPLGRFNGDPNAAIARSTQKGEFDQVAPQVFIVDTNSRQIIEIPSARGARQIAVCPGEHRVFFRRGGSLLGQPLASDGRPQGQATTIAVSGLASLEGCIREGGQWLLWTTTAAGDVQLVNASSEKRQSMPSWLATLAPEDVSRRRDVLRKLYALRPDGSVAAVSDGALTISKDDTTVDTIDTGNPVIHFASPAYWLSQDGPLVVAIGFRERP